MIVYKMFRKGLVCMGYQYHQGLNRCDHANCVKNGFHACENPLDCLSYYPDWNHSECWLCDAGGDIDEDGMDSKISCTELYIAGKLDRELFLYEALHFMYRHPHRELSGLIRHDEGTADHNGMCVVIGDDPTATATHDGDVLLLIVGKDGEGTGETVIRSAHMVTGTAAGNVYHTKDGFNVGKGWER